jgi:hypothetical protein
MARDFDGSNDYLSESIDLSAYSTITIACRINPDSWKTSAGQFDMIWELTTDGQVNAGGFALYNSGSDQLVMVANGGSGCGRTACSRPSTGAWHALVATYDFTQSTVATELRLWIDGSEGSFAGSFGSAQSDSATFANSTLWLAIRNSASHPLDAKMAEFAIWGGVALTADEIAAYSSGMSPLAVRPQSLFRYRPLFARAANEECWVSGTSATVSGATAADHPRIIYPAWPEIILSAAAAADSSGAGSSSGSSTVAGAGASINAQAGVSAGSASVSGVGASTNAQAGSSSGTATVSGVGASIHEAAGASAGTATVSGVGDSTSAGSAAGSSAGTVTVAGVGASTHAAVGAAEGSSSASGVSFVGEAQIEVVLSLRGGSGGGSSGPEYRGDSIAYRYGVSTPGIATKREEEPWETDTEESPEPEKSVVPEAQPSLTLEDVRRAYRKLAALEVSEPIRATRDEIEREIAEAQADQAALRALMIRIDAVLTEIRQEEDEIAMLLIMAAA